MDKGSLSRECSFCCNSQESSPKSLSMLTKIGKKGFREAIFLPNGMTKNNISLSYNENIYKINGKVDEISNEKHVYHEMFYQRTFDKKIKKAQLDFDGNELFVLGEFE